MGVGDTIVALSSGALPAGVAVIRLSGRQAGDVLKTLCGDLPAPREMALRRLSFSGETIDAGLVVFFPGPYSFTGEDCAELQVHGSDAVVKKTLEVVCSIKGVRLAEAGEFTRRAFENGKLNLIEAEGLSDLIVAQTETQRLQAFSRMDGALTLRVEDWHSQLLRLRAEIEARLDFSDESDVDLSLPADWPERLTAVSHSLQKALDEISGGRIVRDGYRVALAGPPNAGKSSLLNALSRSDIAIVSAEAGTTRDVREVPVDLDGRLVIFIDLAGLRESESLAETEGVKRAEAEIKSADLVLWLSPADAPMAANIEVENLLRVGTKSDLGTIANVDLSVSAIEKQGLEALLEVVEARAGEAAQLREPPLVSHARDREAIVGTLDALAGIDQSMHNLEVVAEHLRHASDSLARLIGVMDVEHVLDHLFSRFCIGK